MGNQIKQDGVACRRMTEADLAPAHGLSQAVRWAHRREDWQFMLGAGTALCWKYGNAHAALGMIGHWATTHAGAMVRVDVTGDSGLGPWVESLGLGLAGPSVRMVRGQAPASDGTVEQYAILNQAMG